MNRVKTLVALIIVFSLSACMPISLPVKKIYKLESFDSTAMQATPPANRSILISQPDAAEGYESEQMLYVQTPYQLSSFTENAWISSPANMLFPLLIQAFQSSLAFSAVTASPYANQVDYRLDSQVIAVQQNFLTKPSRFEFTVKIVLTHTRSNTILFSNIITQVTACPEDTPYGGVIAGNRSIKSITGKIKRSVIAAIRHHEKITKL